MRNTMHQMDSGVIISFLKAILRKFRECVAKPLGLAGAAAQKLTNRLRERKAASGHLMYGVHACLVPVNYATSNRRIRSHANKSVTDSSGASFEASAAQPSLFRTIRLYTAGRSQAHSVVAIR